MTRPFVGIAATTLVAFLALLVSRFPGFRQFGFVLGVGIVLCLVAALVLFPILLMAVDRHVRPAAERIPWIVKGAEAVLRTRARVPLAWGLVLLGVVSWAFVAHEGVRMDLDLRNAMAPGDPGRAALESLEHDLGAALIPVYALVDASVPLDDLRGRVAALKTSGELAAADGPFDLFPSATIRERVARLRDKTRGWVEGTLSDLSRLGFRPEPFRKALDEMEARFAAPAPEPKDLDQPAFEALKRSVRYEFGGRPYHVVTLFSSKSMWRPEGRAVFDQAARGRLGAEVQFYSPFHLPDHYSDVLNADLQRIVGITSIGIVLLTLASVGSFRDGLFALAPVVLATGMTLGAAVLMGGKINVVNMAAIPIILAVGVDGGIHFMVRFRESGDKDPAETIHDVGPGIWGSAATTLLGFGSIATSVTPGMASMGTLVVVGTVTSVLASLFLLPGILKGRTTLPRA
jgi:predicted exporter